MLLLFATGHTMWLCLSMDFSRASKNLTILVYVLFIWEVTI